MREVSILALGAAASLGLRAWSPLPAADPFATTLAALPALIAAFAALGQAAEARGARRLPSSLVRGLRLGLGLWALLVLSRSHLDLPFSAPVLAALGALLLAIYLPARLLSLRPLLGRHLPGRPSWVFFALPLATYLAVAPWSTGQRPPDGDEPWYLLLAHSLAYDLDAELTNNYAGQDWRFFLDRPLEAQPGDPVGRQGELYSRHNALLPAVLAPAYRVAGRGGAIATMALFTAALAWLTLRLGAHYFPEHPGETLVAYGLAAFTPPLLLYSHQIWVEVPAALIAAVALAVIHAARQRGAQREELRFWLRLCGLLLLLPLLKIRFMLLAVPLLGLAWWHRGRPWRPLLALGAVLGAVGAGILLFNEVVYDNPLKIHRWQEVELHQYSSTQYLEGLAGLLWDGAFGLFAVAPLWLLLIPAVVLPLRPAGGWARRFPLLLDLGVLVAPYLAIVAPRSEWYGGWSPPFRYALVALPLLSLALVPLLVLRRRSGARVLISALAILTLGLTLLWVAVPGWTYNFADGRTYLLDHLSQRMGMDLARLFPSMVRPRAAAWVWPLLTLALVPLAWWLPARRGWRPGPGRIGHWGIAATLVLLAALPVLARSLPTRVIELEDPYLARGGGHMHPDRWVIERTRYRGGWVLREGEWLSAAVVPGGDRVALGLVAHFARHHPGALTLEVLADGHPLATLDLTEAGDWRHHDLGEHPWPDARSITLRVLPAGAPGRPNGVALDRLELRWR